ncbi:hypothetical protein H0H92_005988, partial [Tricholoma furcatifolium]
FLKETKDLSLTEENGVIKAQQILAMRSGRFPSSYYLREVVSLGPPVASGGTADIYKGLLLGRERVGLKILRLSKENFNRVQDDIMKETVLSKHLRHPNILPLYGVCQSHQRLSLVSPWMENGDLAFYLKQNPEANCLKLFHDVAQGVRYLHGRSIVHGDLKAINVLIDNSGTARICDFGLSGILDQGFFLETFEPTLASTGGTKRWQAPELFDLPSSSDKGARIYNTKPSDIQSPDLGFH